MKQKTKELLWPYIRRLSQPIAEHVLSHGHMETIYRDLFLRELHSLSIRDSFYPVGSAANHSLLYLTIRIITTLKIKSVLEAGAGQTTILLNALKSHLDHELTIKTLESSEFWAEHVRTKVDHEVLLASLKAYRTSGVRHDFYDLTGLPERYKADLLLVDGPVGTKRHSRFGVIDLVDRHASREFVLILDDVQRFGEAGTAVRLIDFVRSRHPDCRYRVTRSVTHQLVIATGRFLEAAFY